jgi:hypothetical protein
MKSRALRKRNRKMEMQRKFDTVEMQVLVEELSHTGSAFGMNEESDGVFFNARLVDRMDLETGDEVIAHCVPNYQDKIDENSGRFYPRHGSRSSERCTGRGIT